MSAHLSRLRLFQRHLRSLVWVGVCVWDWIHSHTPPRTRSPSSRPPPFTHYPFPPRSLVCGGQPSPHKPRLVVSHSTCPPLSSSPHAHSFVIGPAVINTHICHFVNKNHYSSLPRVLLPHTCTQDGWFLQPKRRQARLPRRTVPSNCICRCSRMHNCLPLHILLLHTQVSR